MATLTQSQSQAQSQKLSGSRAEYLHRRVATSVMMSGIIAGLAMSVLSAVARLLGLTFINIEDGFGTLLLGFSGPGSWMVGLFLHLSLSAIFALAYAEGFRRLRIANASIGAAFGVIHWIIVGFVIGFMPAVHPTIPGSTPAPGFFMMNAGVFSFFFVLFLHLMFGAIVGEWYRRIDLSRGRS